MIKRLKYTISEVSTILVPLDKTYVPRLRLGKYISGNQNLAHSLNDILLLYNISKISEIDT